MKSSGISIYGIAGGLVHSPVFLFPGIGLAEGRVFGYHDSRV